MIKVRVAAHIMPAMVVVVTLRTGVIAIIVRPCCHPIATRKTSLSTAVACAISHTPLYVISQWKYFGISYIGSSLCYHGK